MFLSMQIDTLKMNIKRKKRVKAAQKAEKKCKVQTIVSGSCPAGIRNSLPIREYRGEPGACVI